MAERKHIGAEEMALKAQLAAKDAELSEANARIEREATQILNISDTLRSRGILRTTAAGRARDRDGSGKEAGEVPGGGRAGQSGAVSRSVRASGGVRVGCLGR